ncbi:MAG: nodulation protein NfeD [Phenylobacterium sp.]|uniref:NfeD family protein n=1 Tax=Phenylobacterium sp. TaxID=1871053 RepID=UPI00271B6D78|nr:nodulation protein NfeD [Phenylobacterium sp.]MDO8901496.1 nodulation protein NfeD [Phenylobacterium sp.]
MPGRRPTTIARSRLALTFLAWLFLLLGGPAVATAQAPTAATSDAPLVLVFDLDGAVGPATSEYLRRGLETAAAREAELAVILMDTPGGLDSSTREIIADILASPTPVAVFVTPAGSRAASAGTYILYASHLAAMAPGAHLGAATPVQMGGSNPLMPERREGDDAAGDDAAQPDAMTAKVTNDAVAYIRSLAGLHGRNADWAERAVRRAETLTATEALDQGVIEILTRDLDGLLAAADGRTVMVNGQARVLNTAGAQVETLAPNWRARVLAVITNPNIAYLLMMVGVYGLIFEFTSPGAVGPGAVGAVSLLLGLFALNMLPVDYAGVALMALGVGLLLLEALAPGLGIFGAAGAIALALGSVMLFREAPGFKLSPYVILSTVGLSLAFFVIALRAVAQSTRRAVATGQAALLTAHAVVKSWDGDRGYVHAQGEDWHARSAVPLSPGQPVRIAARDGLTLTVEPENPA